MITVTDRTAGRDYALIKRQRKRRSTAMRTSLDNTSVDVRNLSDDDLITLLCATEDEIEAHGEFSELKELLVDCTKELLRRPALLSAEIAPTRKEPIQ